MSQEITVYKLCPQCNGIGEFYPASGIGCSSVVCNWPGCVNGYIVSAKLVLDPGIDDIMDKCNDILDKFDE